MAGDDEVPPPLLSAHSLEDHDVQVQPEQTSEDPDPPEYLCSLEGVVWPLGLRTVLRGCC